jgi:ribonuclease VapC
MPDPLVVLDATAALAWVMKERGADTVDKLLPFGVLPASALTETLYRAAERGHGLTPGDLHQALLVMGVRVEPATEEDAVRAAELIAWSRTDTDAVGRSLSLGDGLCIATAERFELPVTGGDDYWVSVPMQTTYRPFR